MEYFPRNYVTLEDETMLKAIENTPKELLQDMWEMRKAYC